MKTLARHSAVYGLGLILQRLTGFVMVPVYTRFLSPADYGIAELLDLSVWLAGALTGLGIPTALIRFHAKTDDAQARREIVSSALVAAIVVNAAAACAALLAAAPLARLVLGDASYAPLVRIAFATFALAATVEIPMTLLRARERSALFTKISIARLILSLSLNIVFVVGLKMGVLGIMISGLISTAATGVVLVGLMLRDTGFSPSRARLGAILRFGAPLVGSSLGMFAIHYGDRYFLRWFGGLSDVGVYALAYKFGFGIALLVQPFEMTWNVRVFSTMASADAARTAGRLLALYAALLAWLVLGLGGLAPEIVRLFAAPAYAAAAAIIPVVALAYLFRHIGEFFRAVYLVDGNSKWVGAAVTGSAVFGLIAYRILIPPLGTMGAALATLATFIVLCAVMSALGRRSRPIEIEWGALAKATGAAAASYALLRAIGPADDLAAEPARLAARIAIVAAYPLVLIAIRFFSAGEVAGARRVIARRFGARV